MAVYIYAYQYTRQDVEAGRLSARQPQYVARDAYGDPVPDIEVEFQLPQTSPTVVGATWEIYPPPNPPTTWASAKSDASGVITCPYWRAGTTIGHFNLFAMTFGGGVTVVDSTQDNEVVQSTQPPAPATVEAYFGSNQTVNSGSLTQNGLVARVKDQYGNVMAGVAVTFNTNGAGTWATVGGTTMVSNTDANGDASTYQILAGNTQAAFYVTAEVPGALTANFLITVVNPAIICTSPISPASNITYTGTLWQNPQNLVNGNTSGQSIILYSVVNPGDSTIAQTLNSSEINNIPDSAEITSITIQWEQRCNRTSGSPNDTIGVGIRNMDSGGSSVASDQTFATTAYGTYQAASMQWTTFANTGNPDPTKLYGADVKGGKLGYRMRYAGSNPQTADGSVYCRYLKVIVCYKDVEYGLFQNPLFLCEV